MHCSATADSSVDKQVLSRRSLAALSSGVSLVAVLSRSAEFEYQRDYFVANVINLFVDVIYDVGNKLECLLLSGFSSLI